MEILQDAKEDILGAEKAAHDETRKLLLEARAELAKVQARLEKWKQQAQQLPQELQYFIKTHGSDYARRRFDEVRKALSEIV